MRIGVYVGSFNPFHKGHERVVTYLLVNNIVDKIIIVPTGNYWDKTDLVSIKLRIDMIKYLESEQVIIEKELNNLPYTYQLLKKLKERYLDDEFNLIIGSDNIKDFNKWKNYNEILENKVIILNRDKLNIDNYINSFKQKDSFIIVNGFEGLSISSTTIREALNKSNFSEIIPYLDESVINIIKNNKLYGIN